MQVTVCDICGEPADSGEGRFNYGASGVETSMGDVLIGHVKFTRAGESPGTPTPRVDTCNSCYGAMLIGFLERAIETAKASEDYSLTIYQRK
jgi:hypothetical protein